MNYVGGVNSTLKNVFSDVLIKFYHFLIIINPV